MKTPVPLVLEEKIECQYHYETILATNSKLVIKRSTFLFKNFVSELAPGFSVLLIKIVHLPTEILTQKITLLILQLFLLLTMLTEVSGLTKLFSISTTFALGNRSNGSELTLFSKWMPDISYRAKSSSHMIQCIGHCRYHSILCWGWHSTHQMNTQWDCHTSEAARPQSITGLTQLLLGPAQESTCRFGCVISKFSSQKSSSQVDHREVRITYSQTASQLPTLLERALLALCPSQSCPRDLKPGICRRQPVALLAHLHRL